MKITVFRVVTSLRLVDHCWCKHREDAFLLYKQPKLAMHLAALYKITTFKVLRCIK
jgi:hypothetical protein